MKIVFIVGTRPEFIKVAPVYKVFKEDLRYEAILISTGQHLTMLRQLYDFFEIVPNYDLEVMSQNQSLSSLSSVLMEKLHNLFDKLEPDYVLIQGDTTTTFISSLAAYYKKIPVLHLEAGLRTQNNYSPFPEEVNRKLTSVIAEYHFCPTILAIENLKKENIEKNVYEVGNTVIDSLTWAKEKVGENQGQYDAKFGYLKSYKEIVLITAHRRESFEGGISDIASAIKELALEHKNYAFVYPVHLNPNVKEIVYNEIDDISNVFLLEPLNYDEMVYLMMSSYIIMTDSGGIQEEAPSLNKPVIVLRDTTERVEAIDANTCVLAGSNTQQIVSVFNGIAANVDTYTAMANAINPYGDGTSASQLKNIIDLKIFK